MSLEQQIAELQQQLALKQAFAKVQFMWDEMPDPVTFSLVEEKLREAANLLAQNLGAVTSKIIATPTAASQFTDEEVSALKTLANSLLNRQQKPAATIANLPHVESAPKPASQATTVNAANKKAMLLYTDNVPKPYRNLVTSETQLEVLETFLSKYKVSDGKGSVFLIPHSDIEFID